MAGLMVKARLRPPETETQRILHAEVVASPAPAETWRETDRFENATDTLVYTQALERLEIRGQSLIETSSRVAVVRPRVPAREIFWTKPPTIAEKGGLIWSWAAETLPDGGVEPRHLHAFMQRLRRDFAYDPTATVYDTPVDLFFHRCRGVCQDFAQLALACLRARGLVAAYVSGYLVENESPTIASGAGTHAWISVWLDGAGWLELDPTTGLTPPVNHVTLAWGIDPNTVQVVGGDFAEGENVEQHLAVDVLISAES
jgi:transglutaminase-like putative cysteine protease